MFDSPTWTLTDCYGSQFGNVEYPRFTIASQEELRGLLQSVSRQEPRFLLMESSDGLEVHLANGGPFGVVQLHGPIFPTERIALAIPIQTNEERLFVGDWQPSYFMPENLLHVEEVIEIVIEIFQTNEIPQWVQWR